MWRREERLEYWLAGRHLPGGPSFASRLREKLRFRIPVFSGAVRSELLNMDARALSWDASFAKEPCVLDGLGALGVWTNRSSSEACKLNASAGGVQRIDLLAGRRVHNLKLPDALAIRVRHRMLAMQPVCRTPAVAVPMAMVRALECFKAPTLKVTNGERLLIDGLAIESKMLHITTLPLRRTSLKIDLMPDLERQSFLREAEAIKRIPANRAELIAVFRHMPIEMISGLRFLAEKKVILYTVAENLKRTSTRVHDMAAIRDAVTQEIHLVPHRTKCRLVTLN